MDKAPAIPSFSHETGLRFYGLHKKRGKNRLFLIDFLDFKK
jgi:hypothetical protein